MSSAGAARAQTSYTWKTLFTFYGDNTEFFTQYRKGETLLGAQATSAVSIAPSARIEVLAGAFADDRYGSNRFLRTLRPVLSFRYRTPLGTGILGALETEARHGYLEPLEVSQLELTRPLENGVQWLTRARRLHADVFLNWQRVNTSTSREVLDYGSVVRVIPASVVTLEGQLHGVHHGGQLYSAGVPVTNNVTSAVGARIAGELRWLGRSEVAAFRVVGAGYIDPDAPRGNPSVGHGVYLRGAISPVRHTEIFGIAWRARNFVSAEGDMNYSSEALSYDPRFQSHRAYGEIGVIYRHPLDGGASFDAEARLHDLDSESSDPILGKRWEYSYRVVARVPVNVALR